ncbi:tRNA (5-methylaminomethyl-2-thiouridine)(34)-methyltransferase MnmD [Pseudooceanicola sp. CBS1P-1]|uniref:tRNA (5-methylaminomethyl-2-thiouridine)(34)-methyltransferase MnmD n=1 Tax=Pseudooceanicola albus TaxID=2692189 RepID=A0A6L7G6X5_9RHOB|nr:MULTISPECIES: tRNA (5-methylaminomethyl-2-thiouridine)(34)-methyltransferase MnmD [Pseudooceanicola]MBT9384075.1 tRNA (5-methylaminomethyl-2-thiouridine)(34)-methyltransferase MnmD [Pseudooceanicola endophyticus]MXN19825.1 tRNA (5-methylaminomethyl-2-thiouridine)(34)-methyltransferase MnmD [Pseudooceanicola albus]
MQDQPPELDWTEGDVPVATRFDDPYFSLGNGLAETAHVFLAGNGLPERFRDGFQVAELGFGTGLNLLAVLKLWREAGSPGTLRFTTFEAYPMAPGDMRRAQAAFPEVAALSQELSPYWGKSAFTLPDLDFRMVTGDARETVPAWRERADAWFLDGFAPAKNPEMWEETLMQAVHDHTAPSGTVATYTAAGHVRRALAAAGFEVTRAPGFGRKRHMTQGRRT